jgi:hypothetical protein
VGRARLPVPAMIAILTPSRGRPERLAEMIESIRETADGEVAIYVGLDLDDWANYKQADGVSYLVRPRMRLAPWTNLLATEALAHGHEIIGFFGDDHRPRTQGWDALVKAAFDRMGSGLVYGDDLLQGENLPTAPFWSADVIRALGWYYPPTLTHLYADDYWLALANDLHIRTYLPDVLIEHMHPSALDTEGTPKAIADALNAENDSFLESDRDEFLRILRDDHPAILERVKTALNAH